ncbi:helix-turn-helix domain-containing protein [Nibricoccus aquaticus]|uniref:helix-turn-helix domain-containing protein n=1 Tax=Nibricoccus aquaticus TaxID=2576891 RepID=UPI001FE48AD9|nr:helix-turn-helix transcriptional regulator [Nibricoccus aquaticus]
MLGKNLKSCRQAAGLTQVQLAERANLAPRVLQSIEAGKLNILVTTLHRLHVALGCSIENLMNSK